MTINTESVPEFASWRSYWSFRAEVSRSWRYVRSAKSQAFLDAVAYTARTRGIDIPTGGRFYRAQVAHHDALDVNVGEELPGPALPSRMLPLRNRASEGRVNPRGIPSLYIANDIHTAMAESRPWIGSLVSVAVLETKRSLRVVDCTIGAEKNPLYLEKEPSLKKRELAVWAHIAKAFREPVSRDDNVADYAATQVIAEVFRTEGFDGVAYRSAFGTDRYNIALFDLDATELVMTSLFEVRDVELKYAEAANPYYVRQDTNGEPELVRNVITDVMPVDPR